MLASLGSLLNSIPPGGWVVIVLFIGTLIYTALVVIGNGQEPVPLDDRVSIDQRNAVESSEVHGDVNQHNENETTLEQIERQVPSNGGLFPNLGFNAAAKFFEALTTFLTKRILKWIFASTIFLSVVSMIGGMISAAVTYAPETIPVPSAFVGFSQMLPLIVVPLYVASVAGYSEWVVVLFLLVLIGVALLISTAFFHMAKTATCTTEECGPFTLRSQKVVDENRVDKGDVVVQTANGGEKRMTTDYVEGKRLLECKKCGTPHIARTGRIEQSGSGFL